MTKKEAIKIFGNKRKLAAALDISVQAVNAWKEKQIPKLREFEINKLIEPGKILETRKVAD